MKHKKLFALSVGLTVFFGTLAIGGGFIRDADIATNAAIQRSKLASGTPNTFVTNDGSGNLLDSANVPVNLGGTGVGAFTLNGVLFGNGANPVQVTGAGSAYQPLRVPGGGGAPVFGALDLSQSAAVVNNLPIANGGTNASTAAGARSSLSAAQSAVNGDITSMTGVTGEIGTPTDTQYAEQGSAPSTPSAGNRKFYAKSDGVYMVDSSGTETKIGSGSSSGINYISNPGAESNTTGWATYANTAANVPSTGTGGSATNLTFSRSASSPLRGVGSFSMVQTNSQNIQGKGVSYDFTIDSADQAKMISVSYDYNASATFVAADGKTAPLNDGTTTTNAGNSDIEVFVYDKTNSALVAVTPQVITARGSNNYSFKGVFQANSNSTSYRLIFHVATNNANATGWTYKFDNVVVGPQIQVQGPPVTDWNSNLSFTVNGAGTPTNQSFFSRRIGDSLEVVGYFNEGTPSGTNSITLPLTIDSTKFTSQTGGTLVGDAEINASTLTNYTASTSGVLKLFYDGATTTQVFFSYQYQSNAFVKASGLGSSGNLISVHFLVPIAGWSSTVQMSNDTDTRIVAASGNTVSSTTVTSNTALQFTTTVYDTHGGITTGAGYKYTVPVSGYYTISMSSVGTTAGGGSYYVAKNGSFTVTALNLLCATTATAGCSGAVTMQFVAGDTIQFANNASFTLVSALVNFNVTRNTGPSVIAATESVNARYHGATASLSGAYSAVTYSTKDFDSHGGYSGTTYTVPVAGKYLINAGLVTTDASGAFGAALAIYKNGSQYSVSFTGGVNQIATSSYYNLISDTVPCAAGDTIVIQALNTGGTPTVVVSNVANYFSIVRVGN